MFKFCYLIVKNLGRSKVRTTLTCLAVVVLVAIYSIVSTVTKFVDNLVSDAAGQTRLLVTERWVMPSQFPVRFVPQVTATPGVADWTVWHMYLGFLDETQRQGRMAGGFATRMDNLVAMHPGLEGIDPKALEAIKHEKTGVLMGVQVMQHMQWQVGQRFTMLSTSHLGKNLEFKIVGVLPPGRWASAFFFREDYYQEGVGDKETANIIWLRVNDPETGKKVAAAIDERFGKNEPSLKVETESAGIARFAGRSQSLLSIIELVVSILIVDMVIILSNSISITTRERRVEMAVLKVLGFQPTHIMALVIGEAMLVGGLSGLLGSGLTWAVSELNAADFLPLEIGFLSQFPMALGIVPFGLGMGALVGLVGSVIPAFNARKVKVSDVFANIS